MPKLSGKIKCQSHNHSVRYVNLLTSIHRNVTHTENLLRCVPSSDGYNLSCLITGI